MRPRSRDSGKLSIGRRCQASTTLRAGEAESERLEAAHVAHWLTSTVLVVGEWATQAPLWPDQRWPPNVTVDTP